MVENNGCVVTGSNFGGVTSYASNPGYRAWGALKHLEYSNGYVMNIDYNNRLRASNMLVENTQLTPSKMFDRSYDYYADGRLKLADESSTTFNNRFDRLFTWDHQGRVNDAKSGIEAHGETETDLFYLPYRQTYTHDAFGNVKSRNSTLWNYPGSGWDFFYNISNNRVAGSVYDNDGRMTFDDGISFVYDSAGRMIRTAREAGYESEMVSDGSGRETKRSNRVWDSGEEDWGEWKTTYMVHSSVLGRAVTEATETGKKRRTFVIAAGAEIARQTLNDNEDEIVAFVHRDALGLSGRSSNAGTGSAFNTHAYVAEEFDGLGNNVGIKGDLGRPPHEGGPMPTANDTITFDDVTIGDCSMDGLVVPCSMALRALGSGAIDIPRSSMTHESGHAFRQMGINVNIVGMFHPASGRTPPELRESEGSVQTLQDGGRWDYYVNVSWAPQQQTPSHERTHQQPQEPDKKLTGREHEVSQIMDLIDKILSEDNKCSRFFGKDAREALGHLHSILNVEDIQGASAGLGIRMTFSSIRPPQRSVHNRRLFQIPREATVHLSGMFFNDVTFLGPFRSNSVGGQAIQLLHELAHTLFAKNNESIRLLPWHSDGGNPIWSNLNTLLIVAACAEAIQEQIERDNRLYYKLPEP